MLNTLHDDPLHFSPSKFERNAYTCFLASVNDLGSFSYASYKIAQCAVSI